MFKCSDSIFFYRYVKVIFYNSLKKRNREQYIFLEMSCLNLDMKHTGSCKIIINCFIVSFVIFLFLPARL